ncbi:MAG: succinyl-diaminopimelate desuccinylase, partial [Alphaproteobacteria bacterium]|nr:succinyl-diaminopimelate desuccinylase [Alphaproteobacteria bacterium]
MQHQLAQTLTERLIACRSLTPTEAGAMAIIKEVLTPLGFTCQEHIFGTGHETTHNLYARLGDDMPNLAFAGHVDVVPAGDETKWTSPPFTPTVRGGVLYGRGAIDMKGAIACWLAAVTHYLTNHGKPKKGSLSLMITSDEEGTAAHGTRALLPLLASKGEQLSACITGEPTNPSRVGEMIKIGRRGSLVGHITVRGVQGHTGYPHQADNPIPTLLAMLAQLQGWQFIDRNQHFEESHLVITTIDVDNPTTNIIPALARASFNIRFNNQHSGASLMAAVEKMFAPFDKSKWHIDWHITAESFLTREGIESKKLQRAIKQVTGADAALTTVGGTSDSRFIKDYCPVMDFGLVNKTAHQVDECVPLQDLETLTQIYYQFLV